MRDWNGKVAVITGAGSGMGAAMARLFAKAGMKVVVADIDLATAETVAAEIAAAGGEAIAVRCDVSSQDEVQTMADRAWDHFGTVNVLINNAGIVPSGRYRPIWEFPLEDWRWSFDVNMMGVVHGIRSFIPRMIREGVDGHVVTTASVAGLISGAGSPVYSASKHGAVRATEALYASLRDIGSPIGVTLLCPGLVNTNIYRSERNRPQDLAPEQGVAEETPELQAIADNLYRSAITPEAVADMVLDAMDRRQFYLLTSDNYDNSIRERADAMLGRRNPEFESLLALSKVDIDDKDAA
ncbi:MAG: hypothetical protein RL671_1046 [Pseudomonadota bacterium]|jgi:NAD(P)-dependent dehydrogenase (short-subunit alcohol dehydrogenase family)